MAMFIRVGHVSRFGFACSPCRFGCLNLVRISISFLNCWTRL
ncbi:hypothetical protein HanPSC8_Chr15g0660861 [Helianthus annuus]|nr:hypothetical protein HanPSC8_Chr15g0660861 [Helianthus annuus]